MTEQNVAVSSNQRYVDARTERELVEAVRQADATGMPVRIVGACTTAKTQGFVGRVVRVSTAGLSVNDDGCSNDSLAFCGGVLVTVAAGQEWDRFVELAVDRGWVGIECLSGCPGLVGGVTIRNIGAFGQRVGDTVASVRTWDRATGRYRRFAMVDCDFDDDGSRFRRERMPDGSGRFLVLEVAFLFRQGGLTDPLRHAALAERLGVQLSQRASLTSVRQTLLARQEHRAP